MEARSEYIFVPLGRVISLSCPRDESQQAVFERLNSELHPFLYTHFSYFDVQTQRPFYSPDGVIPIDPPVDLARAHRPGAYVAILLEAQSPVPVHQIPVPAAHELSHVPRFLQAARLLGDRLQHFESRPFEQFLSSCDVVVQRLRELCARFPGLLTFPADLGAQHEACHKHHAEVDAFLTAYRKDCERARAERRWELAYALIAPARFRLLIDMHMSIVRVRETHRLVTPRAEMELMHALQAVFHFDSGMALEHDAEQLRQSEARIRRDMDESLQRYADAVKELRRKQALYVRAHLPSVRFVTVRNVFLDTLPAELPRNTGMLLERDKTRSVAVAQMEDEMAALMAEVQGARDAVSEVTALREEVEKVRAQCSQVTAEREEERQCAQSQLSEVTAAKKALERELESVRESREEEAAVRLALEADLAAMRSSFREIAAAKEAVARELDTSRSSFLQSAAEREALSEARESAASKQLVDVQAERDALRSQLLDAREHNESLQNARVALEGEAVTLREKGERAEGELTAVRREVSAAAAEKKRLSDEVEALTAQLSSVVQMSQRSTANLEISTGNLDMKLREAVEERDRLKTRCEQQIAINANLGEECEDLQRKLVEVEAKIKAERRLKHEEETRADLLQVSLAQMEEELQHLQLASLNNSHSSSSSASSSTTAATSTSTSNSNTIEEAIPTNLLIEWISRKMAIGEFPECSVVGVPTRGYLAFFKVLQDDEEPMYVYSSLEGSPETVFLKSEDIRKLKRDATFLLVAVSSNMNQEHFVDGNILLQFASRSGWTRP